MTDGSSKAFDAHSSYVEQLTEARTLDRAVEVQTDVARTTYQGLVAEAGRVNGMVVDMAKEAAKPFELVRIARPRDALRCGSLAQARLTISGPLSLGGIIPISSAIEPDASPSL